MYKRQVYDDLSKDNLEFNNMLNMGEKYWIIYFMIQLKQEMRYLKTQMLMAVSYTHLDVYKRQIGDLYLSISFS